MMNDDMDEQEKCEVDCAVETLMKAEEIKQDPQLMSKVLERTKQKQAALKSIAGLRKKAAEVLAQDPEASSESKYGDDPELRTEEDKAAFQQKKVVDDNLKKMGFKQKK